MKIVVGLGNPGREYERTRHNVGFEVMDRLAAGEDVRFRKSWRVNARIAKTSLGPEQVQLVKPQGYMNRSGEVVAPLIRKLGKRASDLIVIVDDIDLECGRIRIRAKGGAGGHNGLKSMIGCLGGEEFTRIRVGVGPRPDGENLVEHVLSAFTAEERRKVDQGIEQAVEAVIHVIEEGVESGMNRFN
ncbi:MAG: aminoacyl-tRNA hydrolase [Verrucomicrobia bacterium]|nr:aminoacyl-tRNA hydrolase [Verrucomicrobiota bacterium]